MLTPTLAEFLKLTRDGKQIPLRRRIAADLETPVSVFLKLKPHGAVFLLESVERGIQMGRYSFIGVSPYAVARLADGTVAIEKNGQSSSSPVDAADPFSFIRAELANSRALLGDDLPYLDQRRNTCCRLVLNDAAIGADYHRAVRLRQKPVDAVTGQFVLSSEYLEMLAIGAIDSSP